MTFLISQSDASHITVRMLISIIIHRIERGKNDYIVSVEISAKKSEPHPFML